MIVCGSAASTSTCIVRQQPERKLIVNVWHTPGQRPELLRDWRRHTSSRDQTMMGAVSLHPGYAPHYCLSAGIIILFDLAVLFRRLGVNYSGRPNKRKLAFNSTRTLSKILPRIFVLRIQAPYCNNHLSCTLNPISSPSLTMALV